MAEKGKGNIWYEIGIVVLVLILVWTILYPSNVWKEEKELSSICRTRMESIQQLELRYITLTNTYTDSMKELINVVTSDSNGITSLDSVLMWDDIIGSKQLKRVVFGKPYPQMIKQLISNRLLSGKPLGNLANWDMLKIKLAEELEIFFDSIDSTYISSELDSGIVWKDLMRQDIYLGILETTKMPRQVLQSTNAALRKGTPLSETKGWDYFRPVFYDSLKSTVDQALRKDIWQVDQKEQWEKERRMEWEKSIDALSEAERDSIWREYQHKYWEKQSDLVWKKERGRLWKKEGKTWTNENEAMWSRIASQQWQAERKNGWQDNEKIMIESSYDSWFEKYVKPSIIQMQAQIAEADTIPDELAFIDSVITNNVQPDTFEIEPVWGKIYTEDVETYSGMTIDDLRLDPVSLIQQRSKSEIEDFFNAKKDSIWRTQADTLWAVEKKAWFKKHKKDINELINNLWSRERRVSWYPEAFERWKNEKNTNPDELWKEIKEELWNLNKDQYWRDEEIKLSMKIGALEKLDRAVVWFKVLGNDKMQTIINDLVLPNASGLWKIIKKNINDKSSVLYQLGIIELYRDVLLDSLSLCPVSHTPYLIGVEDTTAIKKFSIECPIVDSTRVITAIDIHPDTKDTTEVVLRIPIYRKLFGGGSIQNHGKIDKDGKKSWEKRGQ